MTEQNIEDKGPNQPVADHGISVIGITAPENGNENGVIKHLKEEVELLKEEVEVLEEIIDLEEHAKAGHEPRKAKKYRIRIDKDKYVVEVHEMTGRQILAVASKTPEKYLLSQKLHGGLIEPVGADQVVEFHRHKVERFQTLARDPTEG